MKILVVSVAAETGGALTILNQFYAEFMQDVNNEYILCVSKPMLQSKDNITVLTFPWIKRSWFHRLWFEFFTAKQLMRKYEVDEVFSLQNILLPLTKTPQSLYLHQSLAFEDIRFSLLKEPGFWLYQNIIGSIIIRSVKKSKKTIVQTQWLKDEVVRKCKVNGASIEVRPPALNIIIPGRFSAVSWQGDFFYPASAYSYKNHETLLKAIRILKHQGIVDYRVLLTLKQDSLPKSCEPYLSELQDNVVFLGNISHQEVMELYCKSVLVFPSYIEAYGLPLKEASLCDTPIIVADRPFSREVLMGYDKVSFYPAFESEALAAAMIEFLQRKEEQDI